MSFDVWLAIVSNCYYSELVFLNQFELQNCSLLMRIFLVIGRMGLPLYHAFEHAGLKLVDAMTMILIN